MKTLLEPWLTKLRIIVRIGIGNKFKEIPLEMPRLSRLCGLLSRSAALMDPC